MLGSGHIVSDMDHLDIQIYFFIAVFVFRRFSTVYYGFSLCTTVGGEQSVN